MSKKASSLKEKPEGKNALSGNTSTKSAAASRVSSRKGIHTVHGIYFGNVPPKLSTEKSARKAQNSLKDKLRRKGVLSDNRYDLEEIKKYKGPLLSLEEIREALSFLPDNLSEIIIEDRK